MGNKNKFLFVSKLLFFTENHELIEKNLKMADLLIEENIEIVILSRKSNHEIMERQLLSQYEEKISFLSRNSSNYEGIKSLREENIFSIVGIVDEDAYFSFHTEIPMFNPIKLSDSRVTISGKVKEYGLPINSFQDIIDCYKVADIYTGSYFRIDFDDNFSVISLRNGNTHYRPTEEVEIKKIFQENLKSTDSSWNQKLLLLILFDLMHFIITDENFSDIDYWGTFPSSDPDNTDTAVAFLKEAIRIIGSGKPQKGPEILIRHIPMKPKRESKNTRLKAKADNDFDTLIINSELVTRIKGKVVCIIDDYITNGYSAEATKHLLLKAGAKRVIFISVGKFGSNYFSTEYKLDGDVTNEFTYNFIGETKYSGNQYYNHDNDQGILGFRDLI